MNNTRAETAGRHNSYLPHLRRMTECSSTECLHNYPHHIIPKLNQQRTDHPPAFSHRLSALIAQHPVPINAALHFAGRTQLDAIVQLPHRKQAHQRRLEQLHNRYATFCGERRYKRVRATLQKQGRTDLELNVVREFAEELERDPDPHFAGSYDWYCTGSTMCVLTAASLDDLDWLAHVESPGGQMNRLVLSRLRISARSEAISLEASRRFEAISEQLAADGQIYELRSDLRRLCVRQKHRVSIVDVLEARLLEQFSAAGVPFVSAAMDASGDWLITVDVERMVAVWPIGAGAAKPSHSAPLSGSYKCASISDPWSTVREFAPNVSAIGDRERVRLFDSRQAADAGDQPLYAHCFRSYLERCEVIGCVETNAVAGESRFVVGTSHRLFALDVRMGGGVMVGEEQEAGEEADEADRADVLQWTHQLQSLPTMLACESGGSEAGAGELIVVAAHLPGDMRLCETQQRADTGSRYLAQTMPYRPPSLADSFQIVRRSGECLDALCRIPQQLRSSITGVQLWRPTRSATGNNRKSTPIHLLQQNSAGDIFAQSLHARPNSHAPTINRGRIRSAFGLWDAQLQQLTNPLADDTFYATDITSLRAMAGVVARNVCNPFGVGGAGMVDTSALAPAAAGGGARSDDEEAARKEEQPRWRQPVRKMRQYVDALAPSMLEIWQMPEEVTKAEDGGVSVGTSASATGSRSRKDRISAWLERTSTQQDPIKEDVKTGEGEVAETAAPLPVPLMDLSVSTIGGPTQTQTQVTQACEGNETMEQLVVADDADEAMLNEKDARAAKDRSPEPEPEPVLELEPVAKPVEPEVVEPMQIDVEVEVAPRRIPATSVAEVWDESNRTLAIEMQLDDAAQLAADTARLAATGGRTGKKKKKTRAFVPGF